MRKTGDTWRWVETITKTGETDQGVTSLFVSIVSKKHICLSKSAISVMIFLKAVNEAELTVSLTDKAPLIARCSSGKVLVLLLALTVCGHSLSPL